jgi:hypothetical protein
MHSYRLVLRPPDPGAYPGEGMPEMTEYHWPPVIGPDGRNHFATVTYAVPLAFYRIWEKDLVPVNRAEAAHYAFWQEAHHDEAQAAELEAEWCAHGGHLLQALRDRGDTLAGAALVILEAQDAAS